MMLRIPKISLKLMFLCFCSKMYAQDFKHKAVIEPVPATGFYGISITPELSSYFKTDFSDLRILGDKGNAMPFIIKNNIPLIKPDHYRLLKIISNENTDSGKNIMVFENDGNDRISSFLLRIKNASVNRAIDLSGSEDKKHWFSIAENINLEKKFITDDDSYINEVVFPLSSYHYFRLTIYNGKNDPLNIIQVGKFAGEEVKTVTLFTDNPPLKFTKNDRIGDASYITVYNPLLFHISRISLLLKGPKYFKRYAYITASNQTLADIVISSDTLVQFYLPVFKDSVWEIKIENGDNPPLEIKSLLTGQEVKKAIAYLEEGKNYSLQLNNEKAKLPQYDLQHFKDSVPFDVPELKISKIETIDNTNQSPDKTLFSKRWVWPVMVFVLLALSFFTWRLIAEIGKKNK